MGMEYMLLFLERKANEADSDQRGHTATVVLYLGACCMGSNKALV